MRIEIYRKLSYSIRKFNRISYSMLHKWILYLSILKLSHLSKFTIFHLSKLKINQIIRNSVKFSLLILTVWNTFIWKCHQFLIGRLAKFQLKSENFNNQAKICSKCIGKWYHSKNNIYVDDCDSNIVPHSPIHLFTYFTKKTWILLLHWNIFLTPNNSMHARNFYLNFL